LVPAGEFHLRGGVGQCQTTLGVAGTALWGRRRVRSGCWGTVVAREVAEGRPNGKNQPPGNYRLDTAWGPKVLGPGPPRTAARPGTTSLRTKKERENSRRPNLSGRAVKELRNNLPINLQEEGGGTKRVWGASRLRKTAPSPREEPNSRGTIAILTSGTIRSHGWGGRNQVCENVLYGRPRRGWVWGNDDDYTRQGTKGKRTTKEKRDPYPAGMKTVSYTQRARGSHGRVPKGAWAWG